MVITKQSVLITGCSKGGIGSALVTEFQSRGLHVFATARDLAKMNHISTLKNVTLICLDVTDEASIEAAVARVRAVTGRLDYLVNNSGTQHVAPVLETKLAVAKSIFNVNFFGVLLMSQAFAPLLIATKNGCIVNVCSISGHVHAPWMGVYQASKAAVEMLSETMRLELQPLQVRVVSLVTGAVDTNIMKGSTTVSLASTSPYKVGSVEAAMNKLTRPDDGIKRVPAADFARAVVSDVLGGAAGKIWRGPMAVHYARLGQSEQENFCPKTNGFKDRTLIGKAGFEDLTESKE
ncbi:NADPH-dependent 1-acyldihydroxyacetone phosphate reductase [Akanthomyces lecanii RCEF 1005]|uniref:NADPH-dependent 1-acyldihydroxyacetone phosphate reductase n=1 Tax=Akanthomyces lecanii RCEF 1005 TaxID=1081108 RepID=A0A162KXV7_CORDF|nr:NADPH-dependent 1-acyldihydroxyacetone phosphate reductase [Akanthomyces lecanii RCEF 1005]